MRQDLALVFALSDVEFLLCDDTGQRLTGVADDARRPGCAELAIPLRESACLPAQALRQGAPLCSLEALEQAPTAIIDEQLRHLLAAEGLLCLPLIADHRPVGVAMAGVSRQHWQSLANQRDLLKLFARQLARFLDHASQALRAQRQQLDEQRDGQRLEIRKLLHEINNPLAIVTNYLHILALKLGEENPAAGEIAILKEEIVRIGDLLARLGNLDGQPPTEGGPLQLNRIVSDLFKLFDQSLFLSRGIRAELELDEEIPPLALSSGALRQVIVNLVKNAAEAMPEGGVLRLTTRDRVHKNGALFVELQIRDSGPGLPEEVLAVLFTPVASTKPGHSGLGLTIVKNLLDRLSAEISCSSTPTAGTRFQILLPRVVVPGGNVDG
jgi:nitrogen-specific signal transduction histidine kinase